MKRGSDCFVEPPIPQSSSSSDCTDITVDVSEALSQSSPTEESPKHMDNLGTGQCILHTADYNYYNILWSACNCAAEDNATDHVRNTDVGQWRCVITLMHDCLS